MSKATDNHTTTRRTVLAGLAAAPAAAAVPALAAGDPDAALFDLLRRRNEILPLVLADVSRTEAEQDAWAANVQAIEEEAAAFPVQTQKGLSAYAKLVREATEGFDVNLNRDDHVGLLWSSLFAKIDALAS